MKETVQLYRIPFEGSDEAIPGPDIVGNKGNNLMRIAGHVPVPPGFVIPVAFSRRYRTTQTSLLREMEDRIREEIEYLEQKTGKELNSKRTPLLVSVRSGAAVSMPGMMDSVLNIGLNNDTMRGLIRQTGNPKFAWDCMRRFIQQYSEVVLRLPPRPFEDVIEESLRNSQVSCPEDLDIDSLKEIVAAFSFLFKMNAGIPFPQSPVEQVYSAIEAVVRSWYGKAASAYRRIHSIADDLGTAVIVQAMVFGNMGRRSGSGVGFTRNPANGEREVYIDYLYNTQGEDVVSGRRNAKHTDSLAQDFPQVSGQLFRISQWLENEFGDMQDFEFTVEEGRLYILQTRSGKRTPLAALKIAVGLVEEGIIDTAQAADMLAGYDREQFRSFSFAVNEKNRPIASATSAGTGVATGVAVFDLNRIDWFLEKEKHVILVSRTLSTEDIEFMNKVQGLVTRLGSRTSHPAVVARQLGKVCLVGCESIRIGEDLRHCTVGDIRVDEGDMLSIDGESGLIYQGKLEQVSVLPEDLLRKVSSWGNAIRE